MNFTPHVAAQRRSRSRLTTTVAIVGALIVGACGDASTSTEVTLASTSAPTTVSPRSYMPDTDAVATKLDALIEFAFEESDVDQPGFASVGCPLLTWSPLLRTVWESGDADGLNETLFGESVGEGAIRLTDADQSPLVLCDVQRPPDPAGGIFAVSIMWSRSPGNLATWFDAVVADLVDPDAVGELRPILDDVDRESLTGGAGKYHAGCAAGGPALNSSCFVVWSDDEMIVTTLASGTTATDIDLRPIALELDRFLANTLDEV